MEQVISNYLEDEKYRESFNMLAQKTFGLDFEPWYQKGYLKDNYIPYSIVKDDKIVANVSINKFTLVIDGEVKKAIQIGTVMTDGEYRKQGLSKKLMDIILSEYDEKEYITYLFANDSVLDFYPKLGFERVIETSYEINAADVEKQSTSIKILDHNEQADAQQIELYVQNRKPVSNKLGIIKDWWPLAAYCNDEDLGELYYLEEEGIIVKAKRVENILHIYDVFSLTDFKLDELLEKMVQEQDEKIELHFVPDCVKYQFDKAFTNNDDDALFIRKGQKFSQEILFPLTSHT